MFWIFLITLDEREISGVTIWIERARPAVDSLKLEVSSRHFESKKIHIGKSFWKLPCVVSHGLKA
jgi:hypothetical protein